MYNLSLQTVIIKWTFPLDTEDEGFILEILAVCVTVSSAESLALEK